MAELTYTHFKCNDNDANTVVTDAGSGANNGTSTTNTSNLSVSGKINQAFNFNGTSERIDVVSLGADTKNDTVGSLLLWIKTTATNSDFFAYGSDFDTQAVFRLSSGSPYFLYQYNGSTKIYHAQATNTVNDGTWHHVAYVQDGVQFKIYIDGQLEVLSTDATAGSGTAGDWFDDVNTGNQLNKFFLGGALGAGLGDTYYLGDLDDFRYYKTALSEEDVQQIYNSGSGTENELQDIILPDPPTNLSALTQSQTQIDLSWDAPGVTGSGTLTGYKIERESPVGGGWTTIVADTGTTATTYSNTGLSRNTEYNYRVSAISTDGTGDPSTPDSATTDAGVPYAPTSLTATKQNSYQIDLSWTAPSNNGGSAITGYKIERESPEAAGFSTLVANTGTTATTYSDSGLTYSTEYNYRVSAINTHGAGDTSNENKDTTDDIIDSNTLVLLHGNGGDGTTTITDSSTFERSITVNGNVQLSNAKTKEYFGNSIKINRSPTGDYLIIPDSADLPGGTRNWTIEFFINYDEVSTTNARIYSVVGGGSHFQIIDEQDASPGDNFHLSSSATGEDRIPYSPQIDDGTWKHVAIQKSGTEMALWVDGVHQGNFTVGSPSDPTGDIRLLGESGANDSPNAHFVELRISASTRYTAGVNFTPQTRPFGTTQAPQSLSATLNGNTSIDLAWSAPSDDSGSVTGYMIERKRESDAWTTVVADTGTTTTTYTDNGLDSETEYTYRVTAINHHGLGLTSNTNSATTGLPPSAVAIRYNPFYKVVERVDTVKAWVFDKFTGKHRRNIP